MLGANEYFFLMRLVNHGNTFLGCDEQVWRMGWHIWVRAASRPPCRYYAKGLRSDILHPTELFSYPSEINQVVLVVRFELYLISSSMNDKKEIVAKNK